MQDKPINFFLASGFTIVDEKRREIMEGAFDNITLLGYFEKDPYLEANLICQLSEVDEAIEKLKEFVRVITA